ncbi:AMP-binding protein [Variovorax sp. WS11]|uniref:AMP-binding protein n=1 Tax=Variovorax sp. WS11 TaxID=1105204 RepID=UPI0011B2245C|nr:AMP-binding protein [Variovorax sp. WS11]
MKTLRLSSFSGLQTSITMLSLPPKNRVLTDILKSAVKRYGERTFLQFGERNITYTEFDLLSGGFANGLSAVGLRKGGKLAIMTPNCEEFVVAWLGAAKIGVLYVPINTEYRGSILAHQLKTADVTHILIDARYLNRVEEVMSEVPKLVKVIVRGDGPVPSMLGGRAAVHTYAHLVSTEDRAPETPISYVDPIAIAFTSGTTGPSKGVLASHCHVVTFARDWIRAVGFPEGGAIYSPLPLFHAIAAWLGVVPAMLSGGRIALADRFSASSYWDDVRGYNADVAHGVFAMVPILLKQPERPDDGNQPARVFYTGRRDAAFERRFNCKPVEVYGSTETGIVTMTPAGEEPAVGSSGKPNAESFEVMIANDDDDAVPTGEVGEILIRPRQPFAMFSEYYGMPAATVIAYRNQWFHSGDFARMDADGNIFFADRKKDAIRRRGENISSYEVENAVLRHPEVFECAAVAVKSDVSEDEVKIVVVRRPGSDLSSQMLWEFCDASMPRFWIPRFIEFRNELPRTANHKVQKHLLRPNEAGAELYERPVPTARNV